MKIFIIIFSSIVLLFILVGLIELKLLKVTEYSIDDNSVPKSLMGKKIALISDLHGVLYGKDQCRLLKKLEDIHPDYIALTGDLINGRRESELEYALSTLLKLSGLNIPLIYVFGNHEEKLSLNEINPDSYERLVDIAKKNSILLNDSCFCPEDSELCFVGLNLPLWLYHDHDRTGMISGKIDSIIKQNDAEEKYKVLLVHDPEHFDRYAESGVNLCLCGHLHGGIIRIPFLGGLITPRLQVFTKRSKGMFEKNDMKMIISGGTGWHDIPIRFLNRPEIVVVKL